MRRLAFFLAMTLVLAACAGGEAENGSVASEPSATSEQSAVTTTDTEGQAEDEMQGNGNAATPSGAASGVVTVDGETFDASVDRCEPNVSGEPHGDDLSLVVFLGPTEGLNVDITNWTRTDLNTGTRYEGTRFSVLYSTPGSEGVAQYEGAASNGPEGNWFVDTDEFVENPELLDGPPFEVDGGRLTGALTLPQAWPQGGDGVVTVEIDLEIPSSSELRGC